VPPGGYFGKALRVDLDGPAGEVLELDEETLRGCIGGTGSART
jgi:hypothetical protein